ncbi:uncharacterized protein PV06_07445 [Exophiala oligosperma]|uniref:Uncharacterized protein n=1 Tax=Exophiala oligosperma TaxID=215243 RepID=A0A0D2AJA4_9EURO|nr:uncharacterized protein PV06_07445 [Exophiala oligosperma]KIW40231.1 hypothetical protein PV06_07445 [Exophiala oligosperma]
MMFVMTRASLSFRLYRQADNVPPRQADYCVVCETRHQALRALLSITEPNTSLSVHEPHNAAKCCRHSTAAIGKPSAQCSWAWRTSHHCSDYTGLRHVLRAESLPP